MTITDRLDSKSIVELRRRTMLSVGALILVPELDNAREARYVFPRQWQAS